MRKVIKIEPFDAPINVFNNKKSFLKFFGEGSGDLLDGADGYCGEFVYPDGTTCFGMLLTKNYNEEVIHHEALHLVHMLLKFHEIGVDGSMPNSEMQCYMQSHIVREIKKAFYRDKM